MVTIFDIVKEGDLRVTVNVPDYNLIQFFSDFNYNYDSFVKGSNLTFLNFTMITTMFMTILSIEMNTNFVFLNLIFRPYFIQF